MFPTRSIIFLLFACGAAKAQPPGSDPIFGMTLAKSIHFEQAPAPVALHCQTLKELKTKPFWIFAHVKVDGTEYFILSNRITDVTGVGLVERGNECVEWLAERIINGEATDGKDSLPKWAPLNDAVLKALAQDAFRRYTQAFGGKKNFLDAEHKGGLAPQELPKVFREELAIFSREP
jgi:hypothetical protein